MFNVDLNSVEGSRDYKIKQDEQGRALNQNSQIGQMLVAMDDNQRELGMLYKSHSIGSQDPPNALDQARAQALQNVQTAYNRQRPSQKMGESRNNATPAMATVENGSAEHFTLSYSAISQHSMPKQGPVYGPTSGFHKGGDMLLIEDDSSQRLAALQSQGGATLLQDLVALGSSEGSVHNSPLAAKGIQSTKQSPGRLNQNKKSKLGQQLAQGKKVDVTKAARQPQRSRTPTRQSGAKTSRVNASNQRQFTAKKKLKDRPADASENSPTRSINASPRKSLMPKSARITTKNVVIRSRGGSQDNSNGATGSRVQVPPSSQEGPMQININVPGGGGMAAMQIRNTTMAQVNQRNEPAEGGIVLFQGSQMQTQASGTNNDTFRQVTQPREGSDERASNYMDMGATHSLLQSAKSPSIGVSSAAQHTRNNHLNVVHRTTEESATLSYDMIQQQNAAAVAPQARPVYDEAPSMQSSASAVTINASSVLPLITKLMSSCKTLTNELQDANKIVKNYERLFVAMHREVDEQSRMIKTLEAEKKKLSRRLDHQKRRRAAAMNKQRGSGTPERVRQLIEEVNVAMETKSLDDGQQETRTKLLASDMRVIKAMLAQQEIAEEYDSDDAAGITRQERNVIEKLLLTLSAEQQMRLTSEEQHSQMVDQLVRNQVKLEQQLKNAKGKKDLNASSRSHLTGQHSQRGDASSPTRQPYDVGSPNRLPGLFKRYSEQQNSDHQQNMLMGTMPVMVNNGNAFAALSGTDDLTRSVAIPEHPQLGNQHMSSMYNNNYMASMGGSPCIMHIARDSSAPRRQSDTNHGITPSRF